MLQKINETKKKQNDLPPNPCSGCGALYWYKDCTFRNKKSFICNRDGHKRLHCRSKNKTSSYIKNTKSDELEGANTRKFVHVKMLKKSVKFQQDSCSDLTLINLQTWKRLGKPTMIKSSKIARSVTGGGGIKFEEELIINTFNGKTLKLKLFVLKNSNNLLVTDRVTQFKLWDLHVNSYCQKIENLNAETEKLKKELKEAYPEIFLVG